MMNSMGINPAEIPEINKLMDQEEEKMKAKYGEYGD